MGDPNEREHGAGTYGRRCWLRGVGTGSARAAFDSGAGGLSGVQPRDWQDARSLPLRPARVQGGGVAYIGPRHELLGRCPHEISPMSGLLSCSLVALAFRSERVFSNVRTRL